MLYPCTLYVLKCQHSKWYVGTTECSGEYRIGQHRDGYGSIWTRKHPMIRCTARYALPAHKCAREENAVWYLLARLYGAHNVRGGDVVCGADVVPDYLLPIEFGGTRITDWW